MATKTKGYESQCQRSAKVLHKIAWQMVPLPQVKPGASSTGELGGAAGLENRYSKNRNNSGGHNWCGTYLGFVLGCIFMSRSPSVFHTSSAKDFIIFLYLGANPPI